MKKVLVLLVVLFVLGAGTVFAQVLSDTAQLVLSGVLDTYVNITITPTAAASSLNLATAQTDELVGNAVEVSNVPYNVSATSLNTFAFVNGTDSHAYDLFYDGNLVTPGLDIFLSPQVTTAGQSREIRITFSAATGLFGTYTDEITFTITQDL